MKRSSRRAAIWLCLVPLVVALAACGGGGGGGSPTSPPPPPQAGLTFTPNGNGTGISLANGTGGTTTTLVLNLNVSGVQDLYGVGFHLTYPFSVMHFTGATEGTLLSSNGNAATSFQVAEVPNGNLIVGLTRLGAVPGTSNSGTLLTLHFTAVGSGNGSLLFSANAANNSTGSPIVGVNWNAGSVVSTVVAGSSSSAARH